MREDVRDVRGADGMGRYFYVAGGVKLAEECCERRGIFAEMMGRGLR